MIFLEAKFLIQDNVFQSFRTKFLSSFYVISLALKMSYFLSANHNQKLRFVSCTGATLIALVLHLNCAALGQSESSNFFMYIFTFLISIRYTALSTALNHGDTLDANHGTASRPRADPWPVIKLLDRHKVTWTSAAIHELMSTIFPFHILLVQSICLYNLYTTDILIHF